MWWKGERKYFTLLLIEIYWDLCIIWRTKQKHKKCENKTNFTSCQSQSESASNSASNSASISALASARAVAAAPVQTFCAVRWTNKNNTHKTFDEILGWRVACLAAVGICPGNKRQLCHQQRQMRSAWCCCPAGSQLDGQLATRIHFSSVFAPFRFVSLLSIPISICNTLKWHCRRRRRRPPRRRHLHTVWPQNCCCFFMPAP